MENDRIRNGYCIQRKKSLIIKKILINGYERLEILIIVTLYKNIKNNIF